MKVNFLQDDNLNDNEILVTVNAPKLSNDVIDLIHKLEIMENSNNDNLSIYYHDKFIMIKQSNIVAVEVLKTTLTIYTIKDVYEINGSLKNILNKLNDYFVKISKCAIININHLKSMETAFSGNMTAFLTNDIKMNVSRKYLPNLKKILGI
ncbi:LytTR family DNA-binding domain-containing protein [Apilactobacillus xinyiensis]|uniref:LytTR family DNA-binding domain-containing protein n=1 Tax=Apilactobacillus xinyiensis TaxID=2841032 RepID=UPI00200E0384|nr:LytTR family DNA-binding domain-containing protein [Apilactobacillus xinyiensis]MCL0330227.1 LytTR family transcriptional regulator [Apilactobacillus xinyiensis]